MYSMLILEWCGKRRYNQEWKMEAAHVGMIQKEEIGRNSLIKYGSSENEVK
jgi:hypothetical protein